MAVVPSRIGGDLKVTGDLSAGTFTPPDASIGNAAIKSDADISSTKLEHQRNIYWHRLLYNDTVTDGRWVVYNCHSADGATLSIAKVAAAVDCVGDATCDVDVLIDGVTALDSVMQIDAATGDDTFETGTISVSAITQGQRVEIDIDSVIGTGTEAVGVYGYLVIRENAE